MSKTKMHDKLVAAKDVINGILEQESESDIILSAGFEKRLYFENHRDFYCELENDCFVFYDYNHEKAFTINPEDQRVIIIYASETYNIVITDVEHKAISITL